MSTKIYNAYKLPKMTMSQFFEMVEVMKKNVYKKQLELYKKKFVENCLELYDHKTLYPNSSVVFKEYYYNNEEVSVKGIVHYMMEKNQKETKKEDKIDVFYFHVNFMFYKNRIYALTHEYPNSEYHKVLKKVSGAELYEYYDNVDHPKSITKIKWSQRGKEWDKVLGGSWNAEEGKSVKVTCQLRIGYETSRLVNKDFKLDKDILEPKERLRQFAENNLVKEHFKNDPDTSQEKWNKVWSFICSDEFRSLRSSEIEKLQKKIDLNLNIDKLLDQKFNVVKEAKTQGEDYFINISST